MEWLKGVAGKVATGVIVLAVAVAGLAWWQADPATRSAVMNGIGKGVGWAVVALVLPWASYPIIGWVARRQSNAAGACLIAALTIAEAVALGYLFHPQSGAAWAIVVAAVLIAGVYNTLACDWIAELIEG